MKIDSYVFDLFNRWLYNPIWLINRLRSMKFKCTTLIQSTIYKNELSKMLIVQLWDTKLTTFQINKLFIYHLWYTYMCILFAYQERELQGISTPILINSIILIKTPRFIVNGRHTVISQLRAVCAFILYT